MLDVSDMGLLRANSLEMPIPKGTHYDIPSHATELTNPISLERGDALFSQTLQEEEWIHISILVKAAFDFSKLPLSTATTGPHRFLH